MESHWGSPNESSVLLHQHLILLASSPLSLFQPRSSFYLCGIRDLTGMKFSLANSSNSPTTSPKKLKQLQHLSPHVVSRKEHILWCVPHHCNQLPFLLCSEWEGQIHWIQDPRSNLPHLNMHEQFPSGINCHGNGCSPWCSHKINGKGKESDTTDASVNTSANASLNTPPIHYQHVGRHPTDKSADPLLTHS